MATYAKILRLRIERAQRKLALGKVSKSDLRLLAKIAERERRIAEQEAHRAAFEYAISKD